MLFQIQSWNSEGMYSFVQTGQNLGTSASSSVSALPGEQLRCQEQDPHLLLVPLGQDGKSRVFALPLNGMKGTLNANQFCEVKRVFMNFVDSEGALGGFILPRRKKLVQLVRPWQTTHLEAAAQMTFCLVLWLQMIVRQRIDVNETAVEQERQTVQVLSTKVGNFSIFFFEC